MGDESEVCASAVDNPPWAPGCINLQGNLHLGFRYPTLVGSYKVSHNGLWNPNARLVSLAFGSQFPSHYFCILTKKRKWSIASMVNGRRFITYSPRHMMHNIISPRPTSTMHKSRARGKHSMWIKSIMIITPIIIGMTSNFPIINESMIPLSTRFYYFC